MISLDGKTASDMINATSRFLIAGHFYLAVSRVISIPLVHLQRLSGIVPDRKRFLASSILQIFEALLLWSNQPEDLPQSTALQRYLPWPYEDLLLMKLPSARLQISPARATRFEPFRKTVSSDVNPLTKYVLSLYLVSIGNIGQGIGVVSELTLSSYYYFEN